MYRPLLPTLCMALAWVAPASAGPVVLGLELGTALQLPPCQMKSRHGVPLPAPGQVATCVEPARRDTDLPVPVRTVWLAAERAPNYMAGRAVRTIEIDGMLQGLQFATTGADTQDAALAALTKRFGPPATHEYQRVMSDAGVALNALVADWRTPDLRIHLQGVTERLDQGTVAIDTPAGRRQREAWTGAPGSARDQL